MQKPWQTSEISPQNSNPVSYAEKVLNFVMIKETGIWALSGRINMPRIKWKTQLRKTRARKEPSLKPATLSQSFFWFRINVGPFIVVCSVQTKRAKFCRICEFNWYKCEILLINIKCHGKEPNTNSALAVKVWYDMSHYQRHVSFGSTTSKRWKENE